MPISLQHPGLLHARKYVQNGFYPENALYVRLADGMNWLTSYRHREVFRWYSTIGGTVATSGTPFRFRFRSGYGATGLRARVILAPDATGAGTDPYVTIAVTEVGVGTTSLDFHGGANSGSGLGDAPSTWLPSYGDWVLTPNAAHEVAISLTDTPRVIAIMVHEYGTPSADESIDYFDRTSYVAGGPILDTSIQRTRQGLSNMLRANGGLQVNWGLYDGSARTRSSATPINLIDNSTTGTPTSTTLGYRLVTTARNTLSRTTVPIEMAVYGSVSAGAGGTVRLRDTSGADGATVSVTSTAAWYTATGSISVGSGQKYDLMYDGDGTNTLSVYAVSFYEWETL